ncbi:LOW QUALITY PROTEIN: sterile alpha motif domain-containing protein 15 [Octodon degus]|uniref:LOW QUALITY PROTEIN: sterile alpha motif domain-containing protein 15 n=1 Tax=Octodon degus TaxID=10160 RepID=A0A6P3EIK4_OCTDE|nr:LOW QUALITY PROTEIN: sterile alpha motif domain-containing protein 15 [Octodon degus]
MSEISEDYYPDPDENDEPESKTLEMPGLSYLSENTKLYTAEASTELLFEINKEPQALDSEEDVKEEPENEKSVQVEPTWTSEENIPKEIQIDLFIQEESGTAQVLKSDTGRNGGKLYKDLKMPVDEKAKEPGLEPLEEAKPGITEWATETDTQLPVETKYDVVGATTSERTLELLLEEPEQEALEKSLREKYEEIDLEPSEQTKPDFASEKLRQLIEEVDLQLPKIAKPEISEETQNKSTEEKVPEPLESEYPERKLIVQTSLEPSEKTTSELPKKTRRSDEEKVLGTPAETGLVQLQEIKADIEEETRRKSIKEKVPKPLEYTKPTDQKEKQRTSSEKIELALPEKFKSEETLRNSAEEKGLEPPEQSKLEFQDMETRKPTEETSQVPPGMTKPVQEKRTESTEKNLKFLEEAQSRQIRKFSVKETDEIRNNYALGSHKGSEVNLPNTHYENPPEFSKLLGPDDGEYSNLYFSESQMELTDSFNEKKTVDLPKGLEELVPKDEDSKPRNRVEPQFEFLNWSPEKVAEWISQLGFPQYKECFTANFISGNKLIHVNCSNLPQMGITDFEHMKVISRHIRELLGIEEPLFKRSITLPYRDNIGLFLEQKSHTGVKSDSLTFSEFVKAAGLQDYAP